MGTADTNCKRKIITENFLFASFHIYCNRRYLNVIYIERERERKKSDVIEVRNRRVRGKKIS